MTCPEDMDELEANVEDGWPYPDKETVSHEAPTADEADDYGEPDFIPFFEDDAYDEDFWPDPYPNDFAEDD